VAIAKTWVDIAKVWVAIAMTYYTRLRDGAVRERRDTAIAIEDPIRSRMVIAFRERTPLPGTPGGGGSKNKNKNKNK
jgi:hypothetical protein